MSSKMQLKRKLCKSEEYGSDSDFEGEIKKVSNGNTAKKRRAPLKSDSESESEGSDQSFEHKKKLETCSDVKPIVKLSNLSKKKENSKKVNSFCDSSDDDEPLIAESNTTISKDVKAEKRFETSFNEDESFSKLSNLSEKRENSKEVDSSCDSSDDEPLITKRNTTILKSLKAKKRVETSEEDEPTDTIIEPSKPEKFSIEPSINSDEEQLERSKSNISSSNSETSSKNNNHSSESEENGNGVTSDENEPVSKFKKTPKLKEKTEECCSDNSSDDEPLASKKFVKQKSKKERNGNVSSEEDKPLDNFSKASKQKKNTKKATNSSNDRIDHMKKYLRLSGIHIQSYEKLFESCKSIKSKVEKLLSILHENGMTGRPTIQKCKKLKKKLETKKEIAELDTSNIIKSEGRPKRGLGGNYLQKNQDIKSSPVEKRFSRLKDIIDSEESN